MRPFNYDPLITNPLDIARKYYLEWQEIQRNVPPMTS
jgi:hypothetical protein